MMPGNMTGLDLTVRLKKEKGSLKVIISSGYRRGLDGTRPGSRGGDCLSAQTVYRRLLWRKSCGVAWTYLEGRNETWITRSGSIMNVKVLLVDDHPMLLRGLREAVAQQPNITLVGQAPTGALALKLARELTPDLVVMDIHLPDMNGIEVTRRMPQRPARHQDRHFLRETPRARWLTKPCRPGPAGIFARAVIWGN